MATNFLKYFTGSADRMDSALGAGAAGFEFAAGVGKIYTESIGGRGKL